MYDLIIYLIKYNVKHFLNFFILYKVFFLEYSIRKGGGESVGTSATKAKRRYEEKSYERVVVMVKSGEKEKIAEAAREKGYSVSGYISTLIYKDMGMECPMDVKKSQGGQKGEKDSIR